MNYYKTKLALYIFVILIFTSIDIVLFGDSTNELDSRAMLIISGIAVVVSSVIKIFIDSLLIKVINYFFDKNLTYNQILPIIATSTVIPTLFIIACSFLQLIIVKDSIHNYQTFCLIIANVILYLVTVYKLAKNYPAKKTSLIYGAYGIIYLAWSLIMALK